MVLLYQTPVLLDAPTSTAISGSPRDALTFRDDQSSLARTSARAGLISGSHGAVCSVHWTPSQ